MSIFKHINLPTWITLARIALLPFILFFYIMAASTNIAFFVEWGRLVALILFVIASCTDWIDGFIARKYNMVTNLGKLLDPAADKLLTLIGLLLVITDPMLAISMAGYLYWTIVLCIFITLARDIVTDSLRFIAAEQGITIAAGKLGKYKTTLQMVVLISFMALAFSIVKFTNNFGVWTYVNVGIIVFATILSVLSCITYVRNFVKGAKK